MWTDTALAELQGCLEATDMNIFKEATDNVHKYTDTVCSYIDWCTFPIRSPGSVRKYETRSETDMQLSSQETSWSTGTHDTSSKNLSGLPRGHTPRDLRAAIGKTTTQEACGREV